MRCAALCGVTFHISPQRRRAFKIAVRELYAEMFVRRQPIKKVKDTGKTKVYEFLHCCG